MFENYPAETILETLPKISLEANSPDQQPDQSGLILVYFADCDRTDHEPWEVLMVEKVNNKLTFYYTDRELCTTFSNCTCWMWLEKS